MRPEARPLEFTNGRAHFYRKKKVDSDSQQNEPAWKNVMLLAAVKHIITTLHYICATDRYCRTQKVCQVKIITYCLFVCLLYVNINDGDTCVTNLTVMQ